MKFSSVVFSCLFATILLSGSIAHPIGIDSNLLGKLAVPLLSIGGSVATGVVISELYLKGLGKLLPTLALDVGVPSKIAIPHPLALGHGLGHGVALH